MASLVKYELQGGEIYRIFFRLDDKNRSINFDSHYALQEVEKAKLAIEDYVKSTKSGRPIKEETRLFFEKLTEDEIKRFQRAGIVVGERSTRVLSAWDAFVNYKKTLVSKASINQYASIKNRLATFIDEGTTFDEITPAVNLQIQTGLKLSGYSPNTISNTVAHLKGFGKWAVKRGYAKVNAFSFDEPVPVVAKNVVSLFPAEWSERVFDACPTQDWRTLFALWRFGGLRLQEPLYLKRQHVDLENKKLFINAIRKEVKLNPKFLAAPICPILAKELQEQLRTAPKSATYLIYERRQRNLNLEFQKILFWAGIEKRPRIVQILRASCENDWIDQGIPKTIAGKWLGDKAYEQNDFYSAFYWEDSFNQIISGGKEGSVMEE